MPTFAPAPPAEEDYAAPAEARGRSNGIEPYQSAPKAESFGSTMESSGQEKKNKTARSAVMPANLQATAADSANSAAGAPVGAILPHLTIRMSMAAPNQAPVLVREALIRAGGAIIDEPSPPGRIKARISVSRLAELYERLEKAGKIVERPRSVSSSGTAEITIYW